MTENEAINHLQLNRPFAYSELQNAVDIAIKALEEMQKIKALGDCYIIPKNSTWEVNGIDIHKALEEIQQYREIGTVEKIKEELDKLRNDNECQGLYFTLEERKALAKQSRELSEYKEIGTIEEFKALKEKNEPKKPILNNKINEFYIKEAKLCPSCHSYINNYSGDYCRDCGQKLDWSE